MTGRRFLEDYPKLPAIVDNQLPLVSEHSPTLVMSQREVEDHLPILYKSIGFALLE